MRVLVTGGAGFIGSALVDRLLTAGHHVTVVDNFSTGSLGNLEQARGIAAGSLEIVEQDITVPGLSATFAAAAPELVCHLAAQMDVRVSVRDPLFDATTNVLGTVAVLEAAAKAGARKVLFASSGGTIYGAPERQPVAEDAELDPLSPYAAAKAAAEPYLRAYLGLHGLDYTVLALGNVYGPRQSPHGEAGVVAIFSGALLTGGRTRIFGDGSQVRDYVHVDDVTAAFVHFAGPGTAGASASRVNISTGTGTDVLALHSLIAAAAGAPDTPELVAPRPGELSAITLDVGAARGLGWEPRVALADGIPATVSWVRDNLGAVRAAATTGSI